MGLIIVGCFALLAAFVGGLFVDARLARSAGTPANRPAVKAEVADLVLQLLREALNVVRELRNGQASEPEQRQLPPTRRQSRRRQRPAANSESRKEG